MADIVVRRARGIKRPKLFDSAARLQPSGPVTEYGLEAAQVILVQKTSASRIYAEKNVEAAKRIMAQPRRRVVS